MAKNEKINMPSGIGGLVRYFDEYKSKIVFKPGTILIAILIIIVLMVVLHRLGGNFVGIWGNKMIPGMNPRQMKQAMKRLGMQQEEIDAVEVIIKCRDRNIILSNPSVTKMNMMGQENFQVAGEYREESIDTTPEVSDDDIQTVMQQAKVSREEAQEAIEQANYDLADAIMKLTEE